jgi:homoserine kinase
MKYKISIKVPGTSANLGPGFDLLGLAISIYNEFHFTIDSKSDFTTLRIDNTKLPFSEKEDLLLFGYKKYFEVFLDTNLIIPYNVKMDLSLPFKGGLGSSASALASGFALANYLHKKNYTKNYKLPDLNTFLFELAMMEGHPDNTTPAYLGNFIFSYFSNNTLKVFQSKFPKSIQLFLIIPDIEVSTNESRKKLPSEYTTEDVIFNMARIATWIEFLKSKKYSDLKNALEDKIHTPYRISNHSFLNSVASIVLKSGGAYSLSGSGPSILIYLEKNHTDKFFNRFNKEIELLKKNISFSIHKVNVDQKGLILKTDYL